MSDEDQSPADLESKPPSPFCFCIKPAAPKIDLCIPARSGLRISLFFDAFQSSVCFMFLIWTDESSTASIGLITLAIISIVLLSFTVKILEEQGKNCCYYCFLPLRIAFVCYEYGSSMNRSNFSAVSIALFGFQFIMAFVMTYLYFSLHLAYKRELANVEREAVASNENRMFTEPAEIEANEVHLDILRSIMDDMYGINIQEDAQKKAQIIMGKLGKKKVSKAKGSQDDICNICLEQFGKNEEIPKLTCDHTFHTKCLRNWLEMRASCPTCRSPLTE